VRGQAGRTGEHDVGRVKKREVGEEAVEMRDVVRKPLRRDRRCSLCAVSLAVADQRALERQEGERERGREGARRGEGEKRRRLPARKSVRH